MDFIFDLLILVFFGRGDADVCHSLLCLFVSGSYSKIQVSSPVFPRGKERPGRDADPSPPSSAVVMKW